MFHFACGMNVVIVTNFVGKWIIVCWNLILCLLDIRFADDVCIFFIYSLTLLSLVHVHVAKIIVSNLNFYKILHLSLKHVLQLIMSSRIIIDSILANNN